RTHDQSPTLGISFYLRNDAVDLVDDRAIASAPADPLRAVNWSELAAFIRPFIPDRHPFFIERAHVGVASEEPEQFVDDRLEMELLRGQQRKSFPQIEASLGSENGERSRAGSVFTRRALLQDQPKKIVIL